MQFKALALLSAAAAVSAWNSNDTIVYTTVVVDSYTTVCPAGATITMGGQTITNTLTESSTITITNCPCTLSAPVTTVSSVYCNTCIVPVSTPVFVNSTSPATAPAGVATSTPAAVGTISSIVSVPTSSPSPIAASGANKAFAMSGASLAGLLGLVAYLL